MIKSKFAKEKYEIDSGDIYIPDDFAEIAAKIVSENINVFLNRIIEEIHGDFLIKEDGKLFIEICIEPETETLARVDFEEIIDRCLMSENLDIKEKESLACRLDEFAKEIRDQLRTGKLLYD